MVSGFNGVRPIWDFNVLPSQIDASWGKGPITDWSDVGSRAVSHFQQGYDWGNQKQSGKEVNRLLQGVAGRPGPASQLLGLGAAGGPYAGSAGQDAMVGGTAQPFNPRSVPAFSRDTVNKGLSPDLKGMFEAKEQEYQLPPGYLQGTAFIESRYNPQAKNPRSSAGGLFQQIDSNWKEYGVPGTTRFDPAASTDAAARFAAQNRDRLVRALGREPTSGELYLAHQQGPGGALKLLSNPSARAVDVVGEKAVRLNGGDANMSAGQFASIWTSKLDGANQSPQSVSAQAPGPQTVQQAQAQAPGVIQPALAPKPQDREAAAAVTQNQVQTAQAQQQQPRGNTFMGLPTQTPGGNVSPTAPLMGGAGEDQLLGGGDGRASAPSPVAPMPPTAPAASPPYAAGAPTMPARQTAPYRPPVLPGPQGLDPQLLRALGVAAEGGNPQALQAVQTAIQHAQSGRSASPIAMEQLPDGSVVLVNQQTGEVSPYMQGGGMGAKAPTVQSINGIDHQWVPNQGWVPLPGAGQTKAPETIEQNGIRYQWDPQQRDWIPAVPGGEASNQLETIPPESVERRRQLGIPATDSRIYQRNPATGKLDPITEQRAIDDKAFTQEHQLYQDFENNPVVRKYRGTEQGVQGLHAAFSQGNPAGDMVGVIQLFKTIDPESTVSAGEQATPSNAAGVPESLRRIYNRALGEGGVFSPQLRSDMFNTTRALFINQRGQVKRMAEQTAKRAKRYGLNPENVIDFAPPDFGKASPKDFPDRASSEGAAPAPAVRVVPSPLTQGDIPRTPGGLVTPGGVPFERIQ